MEADTEQKILEAAQEEFFLNGFTGARMQEIADRAGINKSMLHYYFRSKQKLFQEVFKEAVSQIFPRLFSILNSEKPLEEKVHIFADEYIELLMSNPHLPEFVVHEINQNPEGLKEMINEAGMKRPETLIRQIDEAVNEGRMKPVKPEHFAVNLLSMCVFPFVAQPMVQSVFEMDDQQYRNFLEERKTVIPEFFLNAIKAS